MVLSLHVSDINIASLDTASLTFTPANWNLPQQVIFRPVDNHVINPDQVVNISVSVVAALSDDNYDPVAAQAFAATIRDDDIVAGDYDHNGLVERADYNTWRANFGGTTGSALAADGNGNGSVDAADYVLWRSRTTNTAAGAATEAAVSLSNPFAASVVSEPQPMGKAAASDEAFASISIDRLKFAPVSPVSASRLIIAFSDTSFVASDASLELLLIDGQRTSDRSEIAASPRRLTILPS